MLPSRWVKPVGSYIGLFLCYPAVGLSLLGHILGCFSVTQPLGKACWVIYWVVLVLSSRWVKPVGSYIGLFLCYPAVGLSLLGHILGCFCVIQPLG